MYNRKAEKIPSGKNKELIEPFADKHFWTLPERKWVELRGFGYFA